MKPCLFVFCSVQRESLLQCWKRQVQRHGSVLGFRHEERRLPGVSGKCWFLVLIDFAFFLLFKLLSHSHPHLPIWEVVPPTSVCSCVSCRNVGATWTPKRSCSAFHPSERFFFFFKNTLTAVSCLWVTRKSREKVTLTLQNVTDKSFLPTRCLLSSDVNLCFQFFCFSFSGCCPGLRAVNGLH